jgi:uncharacterized membrane protein YccF (DUF307 family)
VGRPPRAYPDDVNVILNIIWLVLSGIWLAIGYAVAGVLLCITVIGIPWGIASFRIASYALWPFGRTTEPNPSAGVPSMVGNVIWLVLAGIWLAIAHVVSGVALCLTIIGIPLGLANFKMVPISLMPLGYRIVPVR